MSNETRPLPEIIIVGEILFPTGSASANNLRGHCRAIQEAGFSVGVLPEQDAGRSEDAQQDGTYRFRGVHYWPVSRPASLSRLKTFLRCFVGRPDARIDWLLKSDLTGVKTLIVYNGYYATVPFLRRLHNLCKRRHVRLLSYVVEWHKFSHFEGVCEFVNAIDSEIQRRWVNPRLDGTICISTYLQGTMNNRDAELH
jgi:hypothetical protein